MILKFQNIKERYATSEWMTQNETFKQEIPEIQMIYLQKYPVTWTYLFKKLIWFSLLYIKQIYDTHNQKNLFVNILTRTNNTNSINQLPLPQRKSNWVDTGINTQNHLPVIPQLWSKLLNQRNHAYFKSIRLKIITDTYIKWW